jgi:hypothetical protein
LELQKLGPNGSGEEATQLGRILREIPNLLPLPWGGIPSQLECELELLGIYTLELGERSGPYCRIRGVPEEPHVVLANCCHL